MKYKFETIKKDYSDFSSDKVLINGKRQITPTYSSGGRCYMLNLILFWNSAMIW